MHQPQEFIYAGSVLILLSGLALVLSSLRVPHIVSFMLAGLLGKLFFPQKMEFLFSLLEMSAIVLLFFFIGLEYSFERLWSMKRVLKPGLVDLFINFIPPFLITYLLSEDLFLSLVLGAVLYPSSTAITAKLFMDYKRLVNPEAELLIGILIFEDLVSIVLLSVFTAFSVGGKLEIISMWRAFLAVFVLFVVFYLLKGPSYRVFSYIDRKVDESLVPFFVLGTLLLSAGISLSFGLSDALIAFMLGVVVPEKSRIYGLVDRSLSDLKDIAIGVFFFMFTFHSKLGLDQYIWLLVVLLPLSVLTKFLSTYWGSTIYGLNRRGSLRASLSFLQRGEFSIIFASFYEPAQTLAFSLVLATALLGSFSFVYAPRISSRLFPTKVGKRAPP
ncbi:MAG: cation:proton antiporter [Acidobacteria bacterium]|jgi:CPA2 family monovalent cation:H+ antiporter-2|nr:MAG: cation:proton antiporter [Acidobacteriota bacterium]